jgi:glycosyltransferase involved in cell wall biosynthesis
MLASLLMVIQVPCFNEQATLPTVLEQLAEAKHRLEGESHDRWGYRVAVRILVIDDGSADQTAEAAWREAARLGIWRSLDVIRCPHRGLAATFRTGIAEALHLGADILVNTDGDNQYPASAIGELIDPVLRGTSDIAIGERDFQRVDHGSRYRRVLRHLGSPIIRWASGTDVRDVTSGFRAYSRAAAQRLDLRTGHTYTVEALLQAGRDRDRIARTVVLPNPPTRPSRLIRHPSVYVAHAVAALVRSKLRAVSRFDSAQGAGERQRWAILRGRREQEALPGSEAGSR